MRVPNIDHDAGSPTGQARAAARSKLPHAAAPSISLTRLAWFDANGDGRIDTRAAGAGGDATLLVPTHEVDLPTYGHNANPRIDPLGTNPGSRAARAGDPTTTDPATPVSAAQTQRAVDAYQRYGQPAPAPAPAVSAAVPTGVADATSALSTSVALVHALA